MGDDYRRKIECEMDRFEAEISSLSRPMGGPSGTPAFIPAQLRRHPVPGPPPGLVAPPPGIPRAPVTISGAPQVYRPQQIRQRIPTPGGARPPQITRLPNAPGSVIAAPPTISARPTISAPPVVAAPPSTPGFVPISNIPVPSVVGLPISATIVGAPTTIQQPTVTSIPLPPEPTPEPKPSTSSGNTEDDKKGKKKKDKKPKKLVRCAGGSVWEDPSLQDWDPSDFRLFCGDLGNDVTDEVLTRVFGRYPSFQKARVIRDKRTNKTKGYGFVSFKDPNDFVRAVKELDGRYVGSRPIKLRKSNWKNRNVDMVRKRETERMALLGIKKKPKLF